MKKYILLIASLMIAGATYAKGIKTQPDSYNYRHGLQAYSNKDYASALTFFEKELDENPDNGYVMMWMGIVKADMKKYGEGLNYLDKATKNIPKKDASMLSAAIGAKGAIFEEMGDKQKAIDSYTQALKISPNNAISNKRATLYIDLKQYDKAKADYNGMLDLNPGETSAYLGLGKVANEQKNYDEAIKQLTYGIKLEPSTPLLIERSKSYEAKKDLFKASEDVVSALKGDIVTAMKALENYSEEPAYSIMETKLQAQRLISPNDVRWMLALASFYSENNQPQKALEQTRLLYETENNPTFAATLASSLNNLGEFDEAIGYANEGLATDTTAHLLACKYDAEVSQGNFNDAKKTATDYITHYPNSARGYAMRASAHYLQKNDLQAVEDFSQAIESDPTDAGNYFRRGRCYERMGKSSLAKMDFEKVIGMDTVPEVNSVADYAFFALGQKDKSIAFCDSILNKAGKRNKNLALYNSACLYSLMDDKEKALDYLKQSFEAGFNKFGHLNADPDLDNIRNDKRFKDLIATYKKKATAITNENGEIVATTTKTTEVPFTKEGGVCKVKCSINNLPLHFIFDTGASSVSISNTEASFMFKNGYLSEKDVIGSSQFVDANGDVSVGTVIILRKVNFGGLELKNVHASVVGNQKAPLLLGQSVLSRLGKIEIDNVGKKLIIKQTVKK